MRPHKIVTAGRHLLLGTATDTASGIIDDENGEKYRVVLPGLVVPGLGHHLFSPPRAGKTGLATTIDSRPRLEQGQHALPLQHLDKNQDILYFDLGFVLAPMTSEPSGSTTALSAAHVATDFWRRLTAHVNCQILGMLPDSSDNGVNFSDSMPPCDVCAFGKSNNNGDAIDPQEGSSLSGKTADISITDDEEIPPTPGNSATLEHHRPEMTRAHHHPTRLRQKGKSTGSEPGGSTRMRAKANAAVAPISHEGINAHQHRAPRNLVLLANPSACDAGFEHQMRIHLDYALGTSNPRSDGELMPIPNTYTFKAPTESSQAAKWEEASDKGMARLEKHQVLHFVSSGSIPSKKVIGTKWMFKVKVEHTLKGRVVVRAVDKSREPTAVAPTLRYAVSRASG